VTAPPPLRGGTPPRRPRDRLSSRIEQPLSDTAAIRLEQQKAPLQPECSYLYVGELGSPAFAQPSFSARRFRDPDTADYLTAVAGNSVTDASDIGNLP
jgi:hypothetical protein